MPRLCELLNGVLLDVFVDGFLEIKKDMSGAVFTAKIASPQVQPVGVSVGASSIEKIVRSLLDRLEGRHESVDQLLQFVAVPGSELRQLVVVAGTMHRQGLLEITRSNATVSLTQKGRDRLASLRKTGQTRLDQQLLGDAK